MTFGDKVRLVREKAGLTTEELAKRLKVSQSYISHVENNRRLLGRARIIMLSEVMNVPVEFFLRDDIISLDQLDTSAKLKSILADSKYVDYFVAVDKAVAADITPDELEKAVEFIKMYKGHQRSR